MDKTPLVERDIEAGRRLIEALDRSGFPLTAALWYYYEEERAWRLVLASPRVSELGPTGAYRAIQEVLLRTPLAIPLHHITAMAPNEHLITELRIFAGTAPAPFIGSTYLQGSVVGETYIEGAYVYRAERIAGITGTSERWAALYDKARKVWTARRCKVTSVEGFFTKIEVEGINWPQSQSRHGISAHLTLIVNVVKRDGETAGEVERWTIVGGRLRGISIIARDVPVEGYQENLSSAGAAT